jgi:hypothetical protein
MEAGSCETFQPVNKSTRRHVVEEHSVKQDRLSRVHVTIFAVEKQQILHVLCVRACVCVCPCLSYLVTKSYLFCTVSYCHLWPLWLHQIFSHDLENGMIFGKKQVVEHEVCFDYLYKFCLIRFPL